MTAKVAMLVTSLFFIVLISLFVMCFFILSAAVTGLWLSIVLDVVNNMRWR